MLELTKLNSKKIFVNPHLIETMDDGVDTRIYFVSGNTLLVKETQEEVVKKIVEYRKVLGISGQDI